MPPKPCQRCIRSVSDLARCNSGWGLRSRASAQVGFISPHRPGRHRRLRPAFAKASAWRAIWPLRRSSQRIEIPPMGSTASGAVSISGEWLSGKSRPHRSRICEPWRCKSSLAHQPLLAAQQERGCRAEARMPVVEPSFTMVGDTRFELRLGRPILRSRSHSRPAPGF